MNFHGRLVMHYPQDVFGNTVVLLWENIEYHLPAAIAEQLHRELGEVLVQAKGRPCSTGSVCRGAGMARVVGSNQQKRRRRRS